MFQPGRVCRKAYPTGHELDSAILIALTKTISSNSIERILKEEDDKKVKGGDQ
jgi:hypothetical protein